VEINVDAGSFYVSSGREHLSIRNLGSSLPIEIYDEILPRSRMLVLDESGQVSATYLKLNMSESSLCPSTIFATMTGSFTPTSFPEDWSTLHFVTPEDGCSVPDYPLQIENTIAVLMRGGCSFYEKISLMQELDASAVVMVNIFEPFNLFSMAHDSTGRESMLPAVMMQGGRWEELNLCYLSHLQETGEQLKAKIVHLKSHISEEGNSISGSLDEFVYESLSGARFQVRKEGKVHHLSVL
jgi:hypothetical protein